MRKKNGNFGMQPCWLPKHILSVLLCCAVLLGMLPVIALPTNAASAYHAASALAYAQEHWNDGVGLCAEFVSRCINAGGCSAFSVSASMLLGQLRNSGMGTEYQLALNSDMSITAANYAGKLAAGDPVFYYCPGCTDGRPYVHTVLCNGMDGNGYMKAYSHNNANNGQQKYRYPNGERDVLQDVCCTLEDGQLSAIVGPSGSGKTTLLSILAGLDSPAEGSVSIDGEDYKSLDLDRCRRERIAMIFQAFHLFPLLNVVENVCFAMELNGVAKSKAVGPAKELLEMVGIGEEKHKRYPAHLSGGEQQRVAIARALASGARVILADEPTGNLDTANGDRVMEILQRLAHEEGYCVVVVTHDMSIAEAADQVLRMKDGVLAEQETA